MPQLTTKERILDAAEEIVLGKSFHSVGLNEILTAVKVPKGSFYHYFESKEHFGVELLRHYVNEHTAALRKGLLGQDLDPLERLLVWFEGAISRLVQGDCRQFCLVSKLGAEVSTFSEPMREALLEGVNAWREIYATVIRQGQEKGVIRSGVDPVFAAEIVQNVWQGAMHRAQIERTVLPLRNTLRFLREFLQAA